MAGKAAGEIVRIGNVSDEQILVDRVALRDGNKISSIAKVFRLVADVRRRKFDLVIDLHSLYETNLLGYLSGAKHRLYANRENRSLDRLANFPTKPPHEDKSLHHAERYLQTLTPLGIERARKEFRLKPAPAETAKIKVFEAKKVPGRHLVGLFLGAGHLGRRWGITKFKELAARLSSHRDIDVLAFLGPEESDLRGEAEEHLSQYAEVMDEMPLSMFVAAVGSLDTFVSTDTGPMHIAAVAGASIVLISQRGAPDYFLPLTDALHVLDSGAVDEITVDEVYGAVIESLKRRKK